MRAKTWEDVCELGAVRNGEYFEAEELEDIRDVLTDDIAKLEEEVARQRKHIKNLEHAVQYWSCNTANLETYKP